MANELHVKMEPNLSALGSIAARVESFGEENELPAQTNFVISLALDELITNTVMHGRFTQAAEPEITLHLEVREQKVVLVMETNEDRFDPTVDTDPDTSSDLEDRNIGGLGLHLVKSMADRFSYEFVCGINRLTLEYDLVS